MDKLKTFAKTFKSSATSLTYYKEVVRAPFSFSLKFFLFYFFIYSLLTAGVFFYKLSKNVLPVVKNFATNLPTKVESAYPDNLTITIEHGIVSTNVKEPYYIKTEDLAKEFLSDKYLPKDWEVKNLLVIDTQGNAEDFPKYDTIFLLTEKSIAMVDNRQGVRLFPLDQTANAIINKDLVKDLAKQIVPFVDNFVSYMTPTVFFSISLAILILAPLEKMIYLLNFAFIAWVISKIMRVKLGYWKCYQVGMHLVIIPTTILGILALAKIHLPIPMLYTLVMTVLAILVLNRLKASSRR